MTGFVFNSSVMRSSRGLDNSILLNLQIAVESDWLQCSEAVMKRSLGLLMDLVTSTEPDLIAGILARAR